MLKLSINKSAMWYFAQKIKHRAVLYNIEKNVSPQEIMEELKKIGLEKPGARVKGLEDYIKRTVFKKWNKEKKIWEDVQQANFFENIPEAIDDDPEWDELLSVNDTNTLLKDMKYILSNLKRVVNDIARITKDIDTMASIVKGKNME